jgi:2-succinyl-5-enolpyruvyl-6-hydroxy-3-cyclohexene-1-carboxylate synthase
MIGASIASPDKLFFGIVGDLSFFYDLNSIGNRHLGSNVRILLVNNNLGAEFHLFKQLNSIYVNEIEKNISAGGHYPNKSHQLVQHFVEDLGFEYISASNKQEFYNNYKEFVSNENAEKPILFEIFTHVDDENQALWNMWHIEEQKEKSGAKDILKEKVKNVIGRNTINKIKAIKNIIIE